MKIGRQYIECPKCKNRWFEKKEYTALATTKSGIIECNNIVEYICNNCSYNMTEYLKKMEE